MMTCEEVRIALGAHALGALDPEEAEEIDLHLATCQACGAELLDLEGVAGFLGKVSERDVELVARPPRRVLERLLSDRARRTRRGRVLLAAAASAAVLVVGGTVWTAVHTSQQAGTTAAAPAMADSARPESAADAQRYQTGNDAAESASKAVPTVPAEASRSPERSASAAPRADARPDQELRAVSGQAFQGANDARGYTATVTAFPASAGTELSVEVAGMPSGTSCNLVVVGRDGTRDTTDSWVIDPARYPDKAVYRLETTLGMRDIDRFEIVDRAGALLVEVPVRK
ncbi:zf-HC2 domain-containing protein [Nonomuraea terrae]|uniref:Zf-HC2 domain-containing protein n=1 Tax=Nonomuraea terrae TaxID=2530383 RepID=A0A4R4Y6I6_9ACTN|nr:zf-HC2 domain-containing protein [Nonomuraea terrae]TDD38602.1 zf-HC2 domain-containing protein [Nonomuraea terrae]